MTQVDLTSFKNSLRSLVPPQVSLNLEPLVLDPDPQSRLNRQRYISDMLAYFRDVRWELQGLGGFIEDLVYDIEERVERLRGAFANVLGIPSEILVQIFEYVFIMHEGLDAQKALATLSKVHPFWNTTIKQNAKLFPTFYIKSSSLWKPNAMENLISGFSHPSPPPMKLLIMQSSKVPLKSFIPSYISSQIDQLEIWHDFSGVSIPLDRYAETLKLKSLIIAPPHGWKEAREDREDLYAAQYELPERVTDLSLSVPSSNFEIEELVLWSIHWLKLKSFPLDTLKRLKIVEGSFVDLCDVLYAFGKLIEKEDVAIGTVVAPTLELTLHHIGYKLYYDEDIDSYEPTGSWGMGEDPWGGDDFDDGRDRANRDQELVRSDLHGLDQRVSSLELAFCRNEVVNLCQSGIFSRRLTSLALVWPKGQRSEVGLSLHFWKETFRVSPNLSSLTFICGSNFAGQYNALIKQLATNTKNTSHLRILNIPHDDKTARLFATENFHTIADVIKARRQCVDTQLERLVVWKGQVEGSEDQLRGMVANLEVLNSPPVEESYKTFDVDETRW